MRIKIFCSALLVLMLNAILLFGQGVPCTGTDDDGTCGPLDSWVIVLAAGAFISAVIYLYRKPKYYQSK